jgi:hypothetical protein
MEMPMDWPIEELAVILDYPGEWLKDTAQKTHGRDTKQLVVRDVQMNLHLRIEVSAESEDSAIGDIVAVSWGNHPSK